MVEEDEVCVIKYAGVLVPVRILDVSSKKAKCEILKNMPGYEEGETKTFSKDNLEKIDNNSEIQALLLMDDE